MSYFIDKLHQLAHILRKELASHPEKVVIFRSTLPQHFDGMELLPDGYYTDGFTYKACMKETFSGAHWTNVYMEKISKEYGFKFLYSAPVYMDRYELHLEYDGGRKTRIDCTHFCYSPELVGPELTLLTQLLLT